MPSTDTRIPMFSTDRGTRLPAVVGAAPVPY